MTIRTIVTNNVAIRCDGCRDVIDGTPWRVNLLDIVAPEVAVGWAEQTPINPGPHQFHADAACVRRWMAEKGYYLCRRGDVREICGRSPCPSTRPRGACATASTATTTSSSPPEPATAEPGAACRSRGAALTTPVARAYTRAARVRARTEIYRELAQPRPAGSRAEVRCRTAGRVPSAHRPSGCPSVRRAGSSASIPTPSGGGPTRVASPPSRPSAGTGGSSGGPSSVSSPRAGQARRARSAAWATPRTASTPPTGAGTASCTPAGRTSGSWCPWRTGTPCARRGGGSWTPSSATSTGRAWHALAPRPRRSTSPPAGRSHAPVRRPARGERVDVRGGHRPFLAELRLVARRSGVTALAIGQLYDASTTLLDQLLLAFVTAHALSADEAERMAAAAANA